MNRRDLRKQADALVSQFNARYLVLARKVSDAVYKYLLKGGKIEDVVNAIFEEYDVHNFMLTNISESAVASAAYGYGIKPSFAVLANKGLTNKIISLGYDGSPAKFSKRIYESTKLAKRIIVNEVKLATRYGKTVKETASALFDGYGYGGKTDFKQLDINKKLRALAEAEKNRLLSLKRRGVSGLDSKVESQIKEMRRYVERMRAKPLRTAYNELLITIEKQQGEAIEKAINVAMQEKYRSQAMMIAQTETSRAYSHAFESRSVLDPDVAGIKYSTSTSHSIFDICFVAGTKISTPKGLIEIEKLECNDIVYDVNFDCQAVSAKFDSESSTVSVFASGLSVECSPNHPFLTDIGFVRADHLQRARIAILFYSLFGVIRRLLFCGDTYKDK